MCRLSTQTLQEKIYGLVIHTRKKLPPIIFADGNLDSSSSSSSSRGKIHPGLERSVLVSPGAIRPFKRPIRRAFHLRNKADLIFLESEGGASLFKVSLSHGPSNSSFTDSHPCTLSHPESASLIVEGTSASVAISLTIPIIQSASSNLPQTKLLGKYPFLESLERVQVYICKYSRR